MNMQYFCMNKNLLEMCRYIPFTTQMIIALSGALPIIPSISKTAKSTILFFQLQATLLNPNMCNPDFRQNRTDWNVPVPSYTYKSYMHNSYFA